MFGIPGGCQNLLSSPEPPAEAKGNWGGLHGGGRARPLGAKNPETWEPFGGGAGPDERGVSSRGRSHLEVEGTNEEQRSGKRAGLWRLGGAPGRGRGHGGEAGLTRAQFPPRGTRRP